MSKEKIKAVSMYRYRGGVREKRLYGGQGTITEFWVYFGDEKEPWRVLGHGPTPGDRKTYAIEKAKSLRAAWRTPARFAETFGSKTLRANPVGQRPKSFREGMRVQFKPRDGYLQLYSRPPAYDEIGTVVRVDVGGERRVSIPGPDGGLVYVHWDDGYIQGVSRFDLVSAGKKRLPPGYARAWEEAFWKGL